MGQLVCPLCGRFVSMRYFDPSRFEADIYAVEVVGLGRGKGVKVVDKYSLLNSENRIIEDVKERILELLKVLCDHDKLRPNDIFSILNIEYVVPFQFRESERKLRDAERDKEKWCDEAEALEVELENVRKNRDEWRVNRDEWKKAYESLQETVQKKQSKINVLEAERKEANREQNVLQETVERKNGEIDTLEMDLEEANDNISKLESEIEALEVEIEDL